MKIFFILSVAIWFSPANAKPEPNPFSIAKVVHKLCLKGDHDASTPEEYCDTLSQAMTKKFHQTCYKIKDHCPMFKDACHKYISEGLCKRLFLEKNTDSQTDKPKSKPLGEKLIKRVCLKRAKKFLSENEDDTFDAKTACEELSKQVGQICTDFVETQACPRLANNYLGKRVCKYGLLHYLCKI
ncbi:uncharacterized protein LOC106651287 [Trichogramma pretiosum]|uniref:uncharacterized protein LOC106651287 n=1 Tax=Trichogramma pretiosum TaxID=7493 RepID=UPI000C71BD45|nr:uncharacterized protein LOC106651287 [Trichogramma pretiosum]